MGIELGSTAGWVIAELGEPAGIWARMALLGGSTIRVAGDRGRTAAPLPVPNPVEAHRRETPDGQRCECLPLLVGNGSESGRAIQPVPMSPAERSKLRKRAWLVVTYSAGLAGIVAITPASAMVRHSGRYHHQGHVSDLAFILIGSAIILVVGLFFLMRIVLDLRDGTVSRYTGPWEERLYKPQAGSWTRLRLPGHRRTYRLSIAVEVRQAIRDGIDKSWQPNRGHVDIARRSRIVVEVLRDGAGRRVRGAQVVGFPQVEMEE